MVKEGTAFEKYTALCELEARHKVDVGHTYKTAPSAKSFTHYIAQRQCEQFLEFLSQNNKFLMDDTALQK